MTLLAAEGFENLNIGDITGSAISNWVYAASGSTAAFTSPRFTGTSFALANTTGNAFDTGSYLVRNVGAQSNVYIGAAFQMVALPGTGVVTPVFLWLGPAAAVATQVCINSAGNLAIYTSATGTTLAVGGNSLSPGQWYYIEMNVNISTQTVSTRVNGVANVTFTGAAVLASNASVGYIGIGSNFPASAFTRRDSLFDDLYICNSNGTVNNVFLGDSRVSSRLPTANGAAGVQFTPLSGSNFSNVNQATQDGDTTYVSSATPGQQDYYVSSTALPGTPVAIYAVFVNQFSRKDDAGARTLGSAIKSGATVQAGSAPLSLNSTYARAQDIYEQDPNTASPWLAAAVLASQFGPTEVA